MSSSAALTTSHLPRLRTLLQEWKQKQPPPKGFVTSISINSLADRMDNGNTQSKDMIVAFRTRPPLENEATEKFQINSDQEGNTSEANIGKDSEVKFCAGISVPSAEPGVFVAHVPGMKAGWIRALVFYPCLTISDRSGLDRPWLINLMMPTWPSGQT
jgi:kinesin family protein 2/24